MHIFEIVLFVFVERREWHPADIFLPVAKGKHDNTGNVHEKKKAVVSFARAVGGLRENPAAKGDRSRILRAPPGPVRQKRWPDVGFTFVFSWIYLFWINLEGVVARFRIFPAWKI